MCLPTLKIRNSLNKMELALQRNKKKRRSLRKTLSSFKGLEALKLATERHYDAICTKTLHHICAEAGVSSLHEMPSLRSGFSALGAVSDEAGYYFDSTKTSQLCAKLFFENAIQNPRHCAFLKNNSKANASNKAPRCVSFITATLNPENSTESERKLCFVVLSGSEKNKVDREKLKEAIRTSVQKMGNNTLCSHKFEFLDPSTETFLETLNRVNRHLYPDIDPLTSTKPCAEKRYISAILGLEYGSNFQITGVSNYALYPFKQEEQDDLDYKTKYPSNAVRSIALEIAGDACVIPEINCCDECKRNKLGSLLIMSHYQRNKDAESCVNDLSDSITVELSEATNQYLENPSDCESIRGTEKKMTLPSWPSSCASSDTRSRTASFESRRSQSSDRLSITFGDLQLSQESTDSIVEPSQSKAETSVSLSQGASKFEASFFKVKQEKEDKKIASADSNQEEDFEQLMFGIKEDTQRSSKRYASLFQDQDLSYSFQAAKEEELEKKAKEKGEKNKLRST